MFAAHRSNASWPAFHSAWPESARNAGGTTVKFHAPLDVGAKLSPQPLQEQLDSRHERGSLQSGQTIKARVGGSRITGVLGRLIADGTWPAALPVASATIDCVAFFV